MGDQVGEASQSPYSPVAFSDHSPLPNHHHNDPEDVPELLLDFLRGTMSAG
ncbi:hypothetical protein ACFXB3_09240 [Streptomyces sp. NPDC059447]|uniref:hypothetical protein n=1 Tax=Streptomyces sp. NPDC059447 TaxID=3346834 RepID=UPI0036AE86EF